MAIRFIKGLKGRDSISKAREELQLLPLTDRRKNHRLALLMKILSEEEKYGALSSAYDELLRNPAQSNISTRAATRGEPPSQHLSSRIHHNSFLPKTIRDLKLGPKAINT